MLSIITQRSLLATKITISHLRHSFADGDNVRVKHQQDVLMAMLLYHSFVEDLIYRYNHPH